jgi:hypothetical protein
MGTSSGIQALLLTGAGDGAVVGAVVAAVGLTVGDCIASTGKAQRAVKATGT